MLDVIAPFELNLIQGGVGTRAVRAPGQHAGVRIDGDVTAVLHGVYVGFGQHRLVLLRVEALDRFGVHADQHIVVEGPSAGRYFLLDAVAREAKGRERAAHAHIAQLRVDVFTVLELAVVLIDIFLDETHVTVCFR